MRLCLFAALLVLTAGCSGSAGTPAPLAAVSNTGSGGGGGAPAPTDPGRVDGGIPGRPPSQGDALTPQERMDRGVDTIDEAAAAMQSPALLYRARWVPGYDGLMEFTMSGTGSGWIEKFLLQVPRATPTSPVPLLAVFHKYGSSHGDVLNTTFLTEARNRGWYCFAPLGARQKNFGNLESQINIRAALNLLVHLGFPIDHSRIYGVGFSMGGGGLANYCARHLDPTEIMFAAICDHTGGVSLSDTWADEYNDNGADDDPNNWATLEVPDILEILFGGTPMQQPFAYQRCSTIDLDVTGTIGAGTDFARNLDHVPTLMWLAANDPMAYLYDQTIRFDNHIQGQTAFRQLQMVPGNTHQWTTLDDHYVCDWLAQYQLTLPTSGSTLADEDGVWFHFQVEQDAAGAFTPFTWNVDAVHKTVAISATANMKRLTIDTPALGISLHGTFTLRVSTADATGDKFTLLGVTVAPTSVRRDGVPAAGTWDSTLSTYNITETDPAQHTWELTFP